MEGIEVGSGSHGDCKEAGLVPGVDRGLHQPAKEEPAYGASSAFCD